MPGLVTYTVKNLPQVEATLRRYAELNTRRTFPEIVNAKTLDMVFFALAETERADRSAIENLKHRAWWNKYIASRLMGAGVQTRQKNSGLRRFVTGQKRRTVTLQGHYTIAQARAASRAVLAARLRSRSFVAAGWLPAIRELSKAVPRPQRPMQKKDARVIGQQKGYGRIANGNSLSRIHAAGGNTSINPRRNPQRAFAVAQRGAERGVQKSLADTMGYIHRKMKEAAQSAGVPLKDSLTGRVFVPL